MTARAEAVAGTRRRLLDAALEHFSARPYDEVTLRDLAASAGTTVQTLLRHFASKETLFAESARLAEDRVRAERRLPGPVGPREAVRTLVAHYERDGDVQLRLLAQEDRVPVVRAITDAGRAMHREWVEHALAGLLGDRRGAARERRLHALVAATDLSTWRLLRRELGLGRAATEAVMTDLLEGLR
jgi:AcrR family transcriptional regulator